MRVKLVLLVAALLLAPFPASIDGPGDGRTLPVLGAVFRVVASDAATAEADERPLGALLEGGATGPRWRRRRRR